jgi:hypothetical protein
MTKRIGINLRLPEDLLAAIDRERGLVPRNAWIVDRLGREVEQEQTEGEQSTTHHGREGQA